MPTAGSTNSRIIWSGARPICSTCPRATAWRFAANGHDLALVALPDPQLDALADEIATPARPLVLGLDLTQRDAGPRLAHALGSNGVEPMIVVNCAGFGLVGAVTE